MNINILNVRNINFNDNLILEEIILELFDSF